MNGIALALTALTGICCSFLAAAQDVPRPTDAQMKELRGIDYSPYPQQNFPNQVYSW
jgi:hypothetical protein